MRKIFFICIASIVSFSVTAQKTKEERKQAKKEKITALMKQEEEGVIAYRKQTVFGIKLTNDGYGFFMEAGRAQSVNKSLLFQVDFAERKHQKEDKQASVQYVSTPFIYGKINFFYPLKLGVQQQILLGNKSNKNGVSVTANFGGGISLGLLRPYMLSVFDDSTGARKYIRYESADSLFFTDGGKLFEAGVSGPNFGTGWNKIKITPGLYAKAALRFDYARFNEVVNALEVGVTGEYYTKKIPQLAYTKYRSAFFNIYVAILFGKRK